MSTKETALKKEFCTSEKPQKAGNVCILDTGGPSPNKEKSKDSIQLKNDIATLTATQLSKKYSGEYSSWANMKQRAKKGYIIKPGYVNFRGFLADVGPRPNTSYTLDRIDNDNLEYGPGLCRWADKHTQNSNKSNNVYLNYKGKALTVAQVAKKTGQKADTLYKRKAKGWSDEEIITGKRKKKSSLLKDRPWPIDNELVWEKAYTKELAAWDTSPAEFYLKICKSNLAHLEATCIDATSDPNYDPETASERLKWDLEAHEIWSKRRALIRVVLDYETHLKRFHYINKNRTYKLDRAAFDAAHPIPDLTQLKNLVGALPQDRPNKD